MSCSYASGVCFDCFVVILCGNAHLGVERCADVHLVARRVELGMTTQMAANYEACEKLILHWVDRILYDAEYIKP